MTQADFGWLSLLTQADFGWLPLMTQAVNIYINVN
jgi:hypothetical protein